MLKQKNNLDLIQVLRGVASLLVVLYHTSANVIDKFNIDFCGNIFYFGSAGVDVFFVLSGFIITYSSFKLLNNRSNIGRFLYKRAVRIFPIYWIIIGLFLLMQLVFPAYYRTHYQLEIGNILATWLLLPGHVMINGVSWSMSYELYFYVLFALAFIFPQKKWLLYTGMAYMLGIIILFASGFSLGTMNNMMSMVLSPMIIEFFLGVCAALIIARIPAATGLPFIIIGIVLFLAGSIITDWYHIDLHPNFFIRVILFGPASFFIITGLVKYELGNRIKVPAVFTDLGAASYSLYLLHLPVLVACIKIIAKFNIHSPWLLHVLVFMVIAFICFVSILFYKFAEKPLIDKLNSLYKDKRTKAAVTA